MAKEARKKLPTFMTPRGVFVYPKLTEPDYGTKDYPKPDGEYSLKFRLSKDDAEEWLNKKGKDGVTLQETYDEAIENAEEEFAGLKVETRKKLKEVQKNDLYTVLYDPETEEETGEVEFKFKMKASGTRKDGKKWSRKPDLFDAKGVKIGKGVNIWGGSEGKISFAVRSYFIPGTAAAGLTLMLNAAQVIDLVSDGDRAASSYGFDEEEGFGYDPDDYVEEDNTEDTKADAASGNDAAGDEDF